MDKMIVRQNGMFKVFVSIYALSNNIKRMA